MRTRSTSLRRLAAGAGALSLAMVGLAGTAAMADPSGPVPGSIDNTATGSLTLYKHVEDAESEPGAIKGDALEGVVFEFQPVENVDLTTAEGWQTIEAAYNDQATDGPDLTNLTLGDPQTMPATDGDGMTTVDGLAVGAYYVTEVSPGNNLITEPALPFIVTIPEPVDGNWNYNVVAYPKNVLGEGTIVKDVQDPSQDTLPGATVDWPITVTVPKSEIGYNQLSISDTLDERLEAVEIVSATMGGVDFTDEQWGSDVSTDGQTYTGYLTEAGLTALNALAKEGEVEIVVVIRTRVLDVGAITNDAVVNINDNDFTSPEVSTNWGALELTKIDSKDSSVTLKGAEFELYAADGDGNATGDPIAYGTTDENGVVRFEFFIGNNEVTSKNVVVKETKAPQGYVLPADAFSEVYTVTAGATAAESVTVDDIENYKPTAPDLPLTGSTGTLLFTIVGIGLIATGGVIAAVRHNRSKA